MESYGGGGGDEKWKLSKKGRSRSSRAQQHSNPMMDAGDMLSRSYSASVSGTRREAHHHHQAAAAASQQGTNQAGAAGLSKKCVEAVKEHRARFYIVRRCVSMLVCWRDH